MSIQFADESAGDTASEVMEERLGLVVGWLLDGLTRTEVLEHVQQRWQVGLRMAQIYVQRAQRQLAAESFQEDRIYYLRLSQVQRDRLLRLVFQTVQTLGHTSPEQIRALATLVAAGCRLLDSRDRTARTLQQAQDDLGQPPLPSPEELFRRVKELASQSRRLADLAPDVSPARPTPPKPAAKPRPATPRPPRRSSPRPEGGERGGPAASKPGEPATPAAPVVVEATPPVNPPPAVAPASRNAQEAEPSPGMDGRNCLPDKYNGADDRATGGGASVAPHCAAPGSAEVDAPMGGTTSSESPATVIDSGPNVAPDRQKSC